MSLKNIISEIFLISRFILKKADSLLIIKLLKKITLFIIIFIFSFHLISLMPGLRLFSSDFEREKHIKEILNILGKYPTDLSNVTKEELAEAIYEEALRYNCDPKLILAIISIESSFQNWSVSEKGAKGLMQIMPFVAREIAAELGIEWRGDRTLFNPFHNVKIGIRYLNKLIDDFEDVRVALTAYNYGPSYVKSLIDKKQKVPLNYYKRLISTYQNL